MFSPPDTLDCLCVQQAHTSMHDGKACPMFPKERFPEGITNGAKWYIVTGGMQDWNYLAAGCMELTLEIGCYKYPHADELPRYWLENREALIAYMEQVRYFGIALWIGQLYSVHSNSGESCTRVFDFFFRQVHRGVHGTITSTIGHPIVNGAISVQGIQHVVRTAQGGDYWRILLPGTYNLTIAARGYESYTEEIVSIDERVVQT